MRCQGPRTPSTCPILLLLCYFHHCTNSHTEHTDTGFLVGANVEKDIVRRRRGLKATRCDLDVGTVYHFESHRYGQVVIMDIMPRLMGTQYDPKTVAVPRDTVHLRARAREVSRNSRKGPKLRVSVRLLLCCTCSGLQPLCRPDATSYIVGTTLPPPLLRICRHRGCDTTRRYGFKVYSDHICLLRLIVSLIPCVG